MTANSKDQYIQPKIVNRVFIIGSHRSGTTYLTNVLAEQNDLYTPQTEKHRGQIESAFFSHFLKYFRFGKNPSDRSALYSAFFDSDFGKNLSISKDTAISSGLFSMPPHLFFTTLMDMSARKEGVSGWIEKTPDHTIWLDVLIREYPDAKFICIHRNIEDACKSHVYRFSYPKKIWPWFKTSYSKTIHRRFIKSFQSHPSVNVFRYEDLTYTGSGAWQRIENILQISIPNRSVKNFSPNTSFDARLTQPDLRAWQKNLIRAGKLAGHILPTPLLKTYIRYKRKRAWDLPVWAFSEIEVQTGIDTDMTERIIAAPEKSKKA